MSCLLPLGATGVYSAFVRTSACQRRQSPLPMGILNAVTAHMARLVKKMASAALVVPNLVVKSAFSLVSDDEAILEDVAWIHEAIEHIDSSRAGLNSREGNRNGTDRDIGVLLHILGDALSLPKPSETVLRVVLRSLSSEGDLPIRAVLLLSPAENWFFDEDLRRIMQPSSVWSLMGDVTLSRALTRKTRSNKRKINVNLTQIYPSMLWASDNHVKTSIGRVSRHDHVTASRYKLDTMGLPARPVDGRELKRAYSKMGEILSNSPGWEVHIRDDLPNWIRIHFHSPWLQEEVESRRVFTSVLHRIWDAVSAGSYQYADHDEESGLQENFFVPLGNALGIAADTAMNMEMGGELSDFAHDQREEYDTWEHWLNLKKRFLGRIDGLEESLKAEVEDGS
ncbi:hypothetical protein C8J57DRAFT_1246462 [Mycena rebaudengoi]|nr:hypothetical protein C8J57DRAFT_1246462 [Mycena rebaudengoi]